jgi:hypothetical protein
MKLTVAHILELIDELPKGIPFEYVKPGKNKAMLLNVDKEKGRVEMARVSSETNEQTPCFFTENNLQTIADSVIENKPFVIDNIFNNGGNTRSVWESILANTSEFYKCMVQKNKNLVWVPTKKGKAGIVEEMTLAEIPVSESRETNNTRNIREEFSYFLSSCVKSNRTTNNSLGTFGSSAVGSYLSMLDKREDGSILLFDYNPEKWKHIQDVYNITDPTHAEEIYNQLLNDNEFVSRNIENNNNWRAGALNLYVLFLRARKYFSKVASASFIKTESKTILQNKSHLPYLTALRTKPFMLLAGISGTGKSRIVRKLAQATTTQPYANENERWCDNRPENFELIQVKPNWHNSMDVVGFYSNISKKYEFTPFVEFIVKAWQHEDTPYFLCLDEMNLAPVEEYFAEFLSAIESRSTNENGDYVTDPIIKPFKDFGKETCEEMLKHLLGEALHTESNPLAQQFSEKGLTLPPNLMVMGTVNMDETTFTFSRKVLDRAMSVEMNEVDYDKFLSGETEQFPLLTDFNELLVNRPQKASEVKDDIDGEKVMAYLKDVNALLEDTPFKLGYRASNEAMLYVAANKVLAGEQFSMTSALDDFTLMKILSRIEGDDQRLGIDEDDPRIAAAHSTADNEGQRPNLLTCLRGIVRNHIGNDTQTEKKIGSMCRTLEREHFVSYWG